MNPTTSPLTVRQGVTIAARAISVYFFALAVANLLSLPGSAASAHHYLKDSTLYQGDYFVGYYVRAIASSVLRLCIELLFAVSFYRCGPRISGFLLDGEAVEPLPGSAEVSEL